MTGVADQILALHFTSTFSEMLQNFSHVLLDFSSEALWSGEEKNGGDKTNSNRNSGTSIKNITIRARRITRTIVRMVIWQQQ